MSGTNEPHTTSRRSLLRAGSFAAAGAAVLAACSTDDRPVGISGKPAPATSTPPTVPPLEPTASQIADDQSQLHTLASVEALVAEVYTDHAANIADPTLRSAAERFATDHASAAEAVSKASADQATPEPNEGLRIAMVDPIQGSLGTSENLLSFLRDLESTLTATYITAAGVLSGAGDRQLMLSYAAACARRVAVLGRGGQGEAPRSARFPMTDLIPGSAYLDLAPEEGSEGEGEDASTTTQPEG